MLFNFSQSGLTKLLKTYDLVDAMKEELAILEPELVKKTAETDELMKTIMVDQEKADRVSRSTKGYSSSVYFE